MKKLLGILLVSCLFMVNAQAQELWKEGTHYKVISDKASSDKKITEFFSFYCPHCYHFEPIIVDLKQRKPENVKFEKVHVNFMRNAGPDIQDALTKAMILGKTLNKEAEVNTAIFSHIHQDRKLIAGDNDIKEILAKVGVSAAEYDKTVKSFAVNGQFKKNQKSFQQFRRLLTGVPNFIVNDKYQAQFQRGMTPDDMVDLLVWLSSLN